MKKHLTHSLAATAVAAMLLSGCGTSGFSPAMPAAQSGSLAAKSTKALEDGYKHIHMAVFSKLDTNKDLRIDEYEAAPDLALRDFQRADKNRDGKLTRKEFMDYAAGGSLFGFMRQDKTKFMRQAREALIKAFRKLDKNKDFLMDRDEMSNEALKKVGLNLTIDGLRVRAVITEFDYDLFERSDRTKDGYLGQAEFEDWAILNFVYQINSDYRIGGDEPAPVEPDPDSDADW